VHKKNIYEVCFRTLPAKSRPFMRSAGRSWRDCLLPTSIPSSPAKKKRDFRPATELFLFPSTVGEPFWCRRGGDLGDDAGTGMRVRLSVRMLCLGKSLGRRLKSFESISAKSEVANTRDSTVPRTSRVQATGTGHAGLRRRILPGDWTCFCHSQPGVNNTCIHKYLLAKSVVMARRTAME